MSGNAATQRLVLPRLGLGEDITILLPAEIIFCNRSRSEKKIAEFLLSQYSAQFPKPKERDESRKYYEGAREQQVKAHLIECSGHIFAMQKSLDPFLEVVKPDYQQTE